MPRRETKTGGRAETSGVIPGDYALSVGHPEVTPPKGWAWTKLTDIARLETGHTPSRRFPEYWGGEVPWIGIKDATANHGNTLHRTYQYTNELGIANSSARILPANTVCLSRTASVGYVVVMGQPMATSQDFVNWVCDPEKLNYQFLKYVLLGEKRSFLRFASGTTHQTIYFPEVKAFHVCLPALEEQVAIAHILGTLDDKIELNRQMNATLEAMAQALFKSWFVDFDPVIDNALAAGNSIPERLRGRADARKALADQRKPLPDAIQNQFPNRFVFNDELGWVPEGWPTGQLDDLLVLQRGFDLPKRKRTPGPYPLMVASGQDGTHNEAKVRGPGVTTGRSGKLGEVTFINHDFWPLNTTLWIREYKNSTPYHSFYLLKRLRLEKYNAGSAVPTLNRNHVHNIPQVLPPMKLIDAYSAFVATLYDRSDFNVTANRQIAQLRDTLLPKLLSGQLRVPDAERLTSRVT